MTSGQLHPVVSILSAILPTPLILIATSVAASAQTLPVSPYPAPVGTRIRYPVWGANRMLDGDWTWVEAIVVGYRDYAGNIARCVQRLESRLVGRGLRKEFADVRALACMLRNIKNRDIRLSSPHAHLPAFAPNAISLSRLATPRR